MRTNVTPAQDQTTGRNRMLDAPNGLALIDFDRLQMAAPERDISYWGAWTWVTMLSTSMGVHGLRTKPE